MLLFPDEIICLIMYNLENIHNMLLVCKRINKLINWDEYVEHRISPKILTLLNKPINIKKYKYFMNIYDNIIVDQVVTYYPYITILENFINSNDVCYIDIIYHDKTIRFLKEYKLEQWLYLTNNNIKYFDNKLPLKSNLHKLIAHNKITAIKCNTHSDYPSVNIKELNKYCTYS